MTSPWRWMCQITCSKRLSAPSSWTTSASKVIIVAIYIDTMKTSYLLVSFSCSMESAIRQSASSSIRLNQNRMLKQWRRERIVLTTHLGSVSSAVKECAKTTMLSMILTKNLRTRQVEVKRSAQTTCMDSVLKVQIARKYTSRIWSIKSKWSFHW